MSRIKKYFVLLGIVDRGFFGIGVGANHDNTLLTKANYAGLLAQGKLEEARTLFLEIIDGFTANHDATHPLTLKAKGGYAIVLDKQGKPEEAGKLYLEVIEGAETSPTLGSNHVFTLLQKGNYAVLLAQQGKQFAAERYLREVIAGQTASLGAGAERTLRTKGNLAMLLINAGDRPRALLLCEEVAVGFQELPGADNRIVGQLELAYARLLRIEAGLVVNPASPWTRYTNGGRVSYQRQHPYKISLHEPAEGVYDEIPLPDEQFEQGYAQRQWASGRRRVSDKI